jgi:hypothetical protein
MSARATAAARWSLVGDDGKPIADYADAAAAVVALNRLPRPGGDGAGGPARVIALHGERGVPLPGAIHRHAETGDEA